MNQPTIVNLLSEQLLDLTNLIEQFIEEQAKSVIPDNLNDEDSVNKFLETTNTLTILKEDLQEKQYRDSINQKIIELANLFNNVKHYEQSYVAIQNFYLQFLMNSEPTQEQSQNDDFFKDVNLERAVPSQPQAEEPVNPDQY